MDQEQNVAGSAPVGGAAPKKSPTMLIVGAVVILVLVAWFMLMSKKVGVPIELYDGPAITPGEGVVMPVPPNGVMTPPAQGTSDELGAIEADLNATDLKSLDEVDQI